MIDYIKTSIIGQFEAALSMLNECIQNCPPDRWENRIANMEFGHVVYHTLCYVDLYLSPGNDSFQLREFHNELDENWFKPKADHPITQTLAADYLQICLHKMRETIAAETEESLQEPAGFYWLSQLTRGELHIYNLRHVQHHAGQLSAHLRRINVDIKWISTGWPSKSS
ncbi:MAG: DinB family protein [Planctomycetaceae bacterium]|nr:DinB family protein [Planctomycetaceae bacterium]